MDRNEKSMVSREMLIKKIEENNLDWRTISSGTSPYSSESMVIMDPNEVSKLNWKQGFVNQEHRIVCINGPKFNQHLVAVKRLSPVFWERPGYTNRGHKVYPIRIFLDRIPEGKTGYRLYREVEDRTTLKAAKEAGVETLAVYGCAAYEEFFLVDATWDLSKGIDID